ncbi:MULTISPECIES: sensor histidine kinase [unclassified Streptomyces]|uniref:sensor histidine kinase n=1 Tax=unclassified Streptomyces TaxID=2593676 RepID=UPI002E127049|nr:sensor histidine kinase [Streptomyces sp. NBC_01186]WSS46515.1 sensor histidine kinase [Streptomyces sp. NBC_01187]
MQLAVVTGVTAVATGLFLAPFSSQLDDQAARRALAIAQATAAEPGLDDLVTKGARPAPNGPVQRVAERVRHATGASYIVVMDTRGIRWSHAEPDRIGERVSTDPGPALAGKEVHHIDEGTLGRSARGKVPLRDGHGDVVGAVSVGIAYDSVRDRFVRSVPGLLAYAGGALGVGALAALLIFRSLQKRTHDLAFSDITALLAEREAMLHGIREGVVALDAKGRIRLVNDEAHRLLDLKPKHIGVPPQEALGPGRTARVLAGEVPGRDLLTVSGGRVLVANRMPTDDGGAVATLRDRTELELLGRELDGSQGLIDALRAQDHEHANRMHILLGLLQLGMYEDAVEYLSETVGEHRATAEEISERVRDPLLAALLVGKATVAAERGVALHLAERTLLPDRLVDPPELASVLGNLVDNALDAASGSPGGRVEVTLQVDEEPPLAGRQGDEHAPDGEHARDAGDGGHGSPAAPGAAQAQPVPQPVPGTPGRLPTGVILRVSDNGPGIPPGRREAVFAEGWSTKEPPAHGKRGLGLALVRRLAERHGGTARVGEGPDGGAEFTVTLPEALHPESVPTVLTPPRRP